MHNQSWPDCGEVVPWWRGMGFWVPLDFGSWGTAQFAWVEACRVLWEMLSALHPPPHPVPITR
jgi:hypothetical protein